MSSKNRAYGNFNIFTEQSVVTFIYNRLQRK